MDQVTLDVFHGMQIHSIWFLFFIYLFVPAKLITISQKQRKEDVLIFARIPHPLLRQSVKSYFV